MTFHSLWKIITLFAHQIGRWECLLTQSKTMDSNRTNISWWIFFTDSLWLYSSLPSSSVWRICTYKQPNKHANDLIAGYEQLWLETPYGLLALQKKSEPPAEKHLETYKYLHLITSHLEPTWTHYTLNTPSET